MGWFESLFLGVVQGVTEFLPVSSDGHLTVIKALLGVQLNGKEALFFFVMLHLGTLAAIVLYYRAVAMTGARGLLGAPEVPPAYRRGAVLRTGLLAFVATLPLAPYAKYKDHLEGLFEGTRPAGVGFLITAAVLFLTAFLSKRGEGGKGPAETTCRDALLIGLAQMFAPLPGVSRSGLTVTAALALGLSRGWAVGFSLLIAVPAILGASVFELKDVDRSFLTPERVGQTVAATVLAGVVGYGAIIWLVRVVRAGHLWYFSVYLVVLAVVVLALATAPGGSPNARRAQSLDRPVRDGAAGPGAGRGAGRAVRALAGPLGAGARAGVEHPGVEAPGGVWAPGLVLGRPLAGRP